MFFFVVVDKQRTMKLLLAVGEKINGKTGNVVYLLANKSIACVFGTTNLFVCLLLAFYVCRNDIEGAVMCARNLIAENVLARNRM